MTLPPLPFLKIKIQHWTPPPPPKQGPHLRPTAEGNQYRALEGRRGGERSEVGPHKHRGVYRVVEESLLKNVHNPLSLSLILIHPMSILGNLSVASLYELLSPVVLLKANVAGNAALSNKETAVPLSRF